MPFLVIETLSKSPEECEKPQIDSVFIILPCYDEARNIENLVRSISRHCSSMNYHIIVINDGSKDETEFILAELKKYFPIIIHRHSTNLGLQAALKTGLVEALKMAKKDDAIVVMDADGTHDPSYIPIMIKNMLESHDLVIGSRYVRGGSQAGVPLHRRVLSRGVNVLANMILRLPPKDATSGYRCYRASVLNSMMERYGPAFVDSKGFEVSLELLAKAFRVGARISEIPITLNYSLKRSRSKLRIRQTIHNYLRLIVTLR